MKKYLPSILAFLLIASVGLCAVFQEDMKMKYGKIFYTDTIGETTSGSGVTVDGVVLKDGGVTYTGDISLGTDKKVIFRDSDIYVNSGSDGFLNLVADGEIDLATADVDINATDTVDIDAANDMTIKVTSGTAGEDLLLTQSGANDSSVTISAAGTGADAIGIQTSAGGIDIDAVGASAGDIDIDAGDDITVDATGLISLDAGAASNFNTSAGDITVDAEAASVNIDGGEADAAAVRIISSNAAGGIDVDCGTGTFNLLQTGTVAGMGILVATTDAGVSVEAVGAANGDIALSAGDVFDIDSVDTLSLNSSGAAINIGNDAVAQAINIGTGAAARTVTIGELTTLTEVQVDGLLVDVNSGASGLTVDSAGAMSFDAAGASNFTTSAGDVTIESSAASVNINANEAAANQIYLNAQGTISGNAINLTTTNGGIQLDANNASNGLITIDAASTVDIVSGDTTLEAIQLVGNTNVTGVLVPDKGIRRSEYYELFSDFDIPTINETDFPFILNNDGGGGADPTTQVSYVGGALVANTTGGGGANGSQLVMAVPFRANLGSLVFETKLHINTAISGCRVCAGFTDASGWEVPVTIAAGDTITTVFSNGVAFAYDDQATTDVWFGVGVAADTDATGNGATDTAPVADTSQTLRIEVASDGSEASFYIDGVLKKSLTANAVTASTVIYGTVVIQETAVAAKSIDVDYIYIGADRP